MQTNEETWDTIAESFDKTRKKPWKPCIDYVKNIPENKITADISCGNGRHLFLLAKKSKKTIGVDLSTNMLKIVEKKIKGKKIKNIDLIHADAVNLPLKNNSVDSIIYIAALHNIKGQENRIKSLREIKRILKKDGTALISVWSKWQDKFRKDFLKKYFKKTNGIDFGDIEIYWRQNGHNIPRFYHLYSKNEFIRDLKKADFEIIKFQSLNIVSKKHPDNYFVVVR